MRSDNPINSSRSAEINNTASPLSRLSLNFSHIKDCAPMSIPLVGCDAINKDGSSSNSRPTTNFC